MRTFSEYLAEATEKTSKVQRLIITRVYDLARAGTQPIQKKITEEYYGSPAEIAEVLKLSGTFDTMTKVKAAVNKQYTKSNKEASEKIEKIEKRISPENYLSAPCRVVANLPMGFQKPEYDGWGDKTDTKKIKNVVIKYYSILLK